MCPEKYVTGEEEQELERLVKSLLDWAESLELSDKLVLFLMVGVIRHVDITGIATLDLEALEANTRFSVEEMERFLTQLCAWGLLSEIEGQRTSRGNELPAYRLNHGV